MILYYCSAFKFIIYQFIFALCFTKITILLRQTHTHSLYKGSLCSYLCLESGERRCLIFFMYFCSLLQRYVFLHHSEMPVLLKLFLNIKLHREVRFLCVIQHLLVTSSRSATQKTLHTAHPHTEQYAISALLLVYAYTLMISAYFAKHRWT